jgi:hypothetical protein
VISEVREAKAVLLAVTKIHEQLKSKQIDRKISTVEGIMLELLELNVADKRVGEDRDPFGEENRDYTRNLGERANRLGGMVCVLSSRTARCRVCEAVFRQSK